MINFSIVVPCYNEANNIPLILERFNQVIKRDDIEVILVNNGSTDNSSDVLAKIINKYPFARMILVPINKGYGFGILSGLNDARGHFLGWTHADMQTDPKDFIRAISILDQQSKDEEIYIKGLRKNRPLFDQIFTTGMSIFESLYLGQILYDINAQPNLFSRNFFNSWENPPSDFSLDLFALYQAKNKKIKIIRFNVLFPERIHGVSSWNTGLKSKWKFIKRTIQFSINLRREL
jgi:glycosyltransferase involved in cell wall biosynthesis